MRLPRKKKKLKTRAMKSERLLFTLRLIFPFFVPSKLRYGIGLVHRALPQQLQKYWSWYHGILHHSTEPMDFFKYAPLYHNSVVMSAVYLVLKAQHKVGSGEGNFSTALQSFTLCPFIFYKVWDAIKFVLQPLLIVLQPLLIY